LSIVKEAVDDIGWFGWTKRIRAWRHARTACRCTPCRWWYGFHLFQLVSLGFQQCTRYLHEIAWYVGITPQTEERSTTRGEGEEWIQQSTN
jgi:hypothetical protein